MDPSSRAYSFAVWPALLLAPLLALGDLSLAFALVMPECANQGRLGLHAVSIVSIAAALVMTLFAWRAWRALAAPGMSREAVTLTNAPRTAHREPTALPRPGRHAGRRLLDAGDRRALGAALVPDAVHLSRDRLRVALVGACGALAYACALAHTIEDEPGAHWASDWSVEPWVIACLVISMVGYAIGVLRLWNRAGRGRGIGAMPAAAFVAGWATLVAALVSPVDPLGARLFSAHMLQHELLMIVAAPLLVLGRPLAAWAWAMPSGWRRATGSFFRAPAWRVPWRLATAPLGAWVLHALALWLWHAPRLFEASLASEGVHTLQHISFLATALLFWWSVLGTVTRGEQGTALVSLFTTMVHTGALGALLTLSSAVWYPSYAQTAPAFGLTALEDQQLGGLIMWVPAGLVYVIVGLALATRWMGAGEPARRAGRPTTLRPR